MSAKYIITHIDGRLICAEYSEGTCVGLEVLSPLCVMGNIYAGRVENVVKNINCAFVEIQKGIKCYYPLDENTEHIFLNPKNNDSVNQGDAVLVQVVKEASKTKPPTVSGKISVTGKYVVLSTDVKGVNISSKAKKDGTCLALQEKLSSNVRREGFGFILRTNCKGLPEEKFDEVISEAVKLSEEYLSIRKKAEFCRAPQLLYAEPPSYISRILGFKSGYIDEIITDDREIFECIKKFIPPDDIKRLRLYEDDMLALYKLYDIEKQLREALSKKVWLKCGGYIVIEQTEALTSIDVNSGKCISKKAGADAKENTVFKVNSEAADEIARQLRLRNLYGIIIIDFINMDREEHNHELMTQLRRLFREDKTTTTLIDITKLGLVEVTRRRAGETLSEAVKAQGFASSVRGS